MTLSQALVVLHSLSYSVNRDNEYVLAPVEREALEIALDMLNANWLAEKPTPLERPDEE